MRRTARSSRDRTLRSAGLAIWSALLLVAVVVASRRMAGTFTATVPPIAVLLLMTGTALFGLLAYGLVRAGAAAVVPRDSAHPTPADRWRTDVVALALTLAPPLLLGTGLLPAFEAGSVAAVLTVCGLTVAAFLSVDPLLTGGVAGVGAESSERSPRQTVPLVSAGGSQSLDPSHPAVSATFTMPEHTLQPFDRPLFPPLPLGEGRGEGARWDDSESREAAPSGLPPHPNPLPKGEGTRENAPLCREPRDEDFDPAIEAIAGSVDPSQFSQWFTRTRLPTGEERIEGHLTVTFAPGQRMATVHLPFHPPLAGVPEIECEPLDGCDVRLRVAAVQTYGLRIEAKRMGSLAGEESAQIGFAATEVVRQTKAA